MRNSSAYKPHVNPAFKRVLFRNDDRPLTMKECGSIFGRLMLRPGKWVALASHAERGTRHGHGGDYFAGICCTDDARTLTRKLQAVIVEHARRSGKPVLFAVQVRQGPCGKQARVDFLTHTR